MARAQMSYVRWDDWVRQEDGAVASAIALKVVERPIVVLVDSESLNDFETNAVALLQQNMPGALVVPQSAWKHAIRPGAAVVALFPGRKLERLIVAHLSMKDISLVVLLPADGGNLLSWLQLQAQEDGLSPRSDGATDEQDLPGRSQLV